MDVVVLDLLQVLLGVIDVVLGHALYLLQRLARMGTRVPNGNLSFLGELVNYFDKLLPSLLVHGRQRDANDRSLRRWIQPKIGLADRLLDGLCLRLVEWRNDQDPHLGRRDLGHLIQGHRRAVHVDTDGVEHVGRRLTGANGGELAARTLDALVHRATPRLALWRR